MSLEFMPYQRNPKAQRIHVTGPGRMRAIAPGITEVTFVCWEKSRGILVHKEVVSLIWENSQLTEAENAFSVAVPAFFERQS